MATPLPRTRLDQRADDFRRGPLLQFALWLPFMVMALYWMQLFYQLHFEWSANPQYGYAWFVAFLSLALLWLRWLSAPPALAAPKTFSRLFAPMAVAAALSLVALRLIHEANVGWRTAQWLHACILVTLSVALLVRSGGLAWLKHFSFPVLFLLVAVPWPSRVENLIVQGLMRGVAALTVEVVGLLNVPAIRHGNLIEISSGIVSVDGACSGVRSLQTALMMTLLAGELYRLALWKRLALIPFGIVVALLTNVGRTSFLTWTAAQAGTGRMESLHDSAGVTVLIVSFGIIWFVTRLMAAGKLPKLEISSVRYAPLASPLRYSVGALLWLICIEIFSVAWFHAGDALVRQNLEWTVRWPTTALEYREIPLSKLVKEMLRYDTAEGNAWRDEAGNRWNVITLRWAPANKNSFVGRGHTPDLCMTGAGWHLLNSAPLRLQVNGLRFSLRRYLFDDGANTKAHVFVALWDEYSRDGRQDFPEEHPFAERLRAAWEGRRHHGLKKIEVSLIGPSTVDEAVRQLHDELSHLIIVTNRVAE